MTEEDIVRIENALIRFENLVLRLENIKNLKTSDKKVFKFDMDDVNKAFDTSMKKVLNEV